MSHVRERFRSVLARPTCTLAANIFDPLSARIAHMRGLCSIRTTMRRST
jgi:2-methylisocitrate lyase-like PEP mutase family enzyme